MEPSFLIIGAPKSGTTALFNYLSKHPDILAPEIKEIDFFNCKSRFGKGLDYYHSHFPVINKKSKGKVTFEASVSYLANVYSPPRIHQYNPKIQMIVLLRNPVERIFSNWNMVKKYYKDDRDWFHRWMERCDERYDRKQFVPRDLERFGSFEFAVEEELRVLARGERIETPMLMQGSYYEQFQRYLKFFNLSQFFIKETRELRTHTADVLRELEVFLGISKHDWYKEDILPVFVGGYKAKIPDKACSLLREYYKEDSAKLQVLLGRSFDWYFKGTKT